MGPEHTTGSQYIRLEYPGHVELADWAALLAAPVLARRRTAPPLAGCGVTAAESKFEFVSSAAVGRAGLVVAASSCGWDDVEPGAAEADADSAAFADEVAASEAPCADRGWICRAAW